MASPPEPSPPPAQRPRWLLRLLSLLSALLLSAAVLAPRYCALGWEQPYEGQRAWARAQGAGVARWVEADLEREGFATGSARFDGEWWFGTYLMAGLGYVQTAREHPELAERHLALAARCVERLLEPRVRAFDAEAWLGEDALDSLAGPNGHAAYLGYLNLLLGLLREQDPSTPHAALNDRISAALARRFAAAPHGLIATYPGELYPVDNSAGIASLAVHARATRSPASPAVAAWVARVRAAYLDPETGLLVQAVSSSTGQPSDAPRGSGSALAAYFLAYADPALSRDLYRAVDAQLSERFLGFGVVREYPATVPGGAGDIDSGPLILGYSVSATGFTLAGARIHGDPAAFARIYATAWLFGAPTSRGEALRFAAGGPLGDALLFALMSAPRLAPGGGS
ncbi:MAG TPA: hypothetical protein DEA08_27080 [Planctomycetes bacterium]|nr:hypothetical protein [Planctomycetota bacterium]